MKPYPALTAESFRTIRHLDSLPGGSVLQRQRAAKDPRWQRFCVVMNREPLAARLDWLAEWAADGRWWSVAQVKGYLAALRGRRHLIPRRAEIEAAEQARVGLNVVPFRRSA